MVTEGTHYLNNKRTMFEQLNTESGYVQGGPNNKGYNIKFAMIEENLKKI